MNEAELRALIRDAVARHLGTGAVPLVSGGAPPAVVRHGSSHAVPAGHPSQALYIMLSAGGDSCLIEPSVGCTHCGYCKTHGY